MRVVANRMIGRRTVHDSLTDLTPDSQAGDRPTVIVRMGIPNGVSNLPRKPRHPFVSADNRPEPEHHDGVFRVVLITSGSVASIKMPDIVGTLSTVS